MNLFKAILICCVALGMGGFVSDAQAASYSFWADTLQQTYSSGSVIPITQANQVLQTRDGYIWVASYDGLVRYDGKHSKVFNAKDDGFPSSSIMALFEDARERLWIGTNNVGLILYDKKSGFRSFGIEAGLPSSAVRAIAQDSAGNVYAATTAGLVAVAPDLTLRGIEVPGFDSLFVADMIVSRDDELWCVLNSGEVLMLRDGVLLGEFGARELHDSKPRAIYQASDGFIYLGFTDSAVVRFDPDDPDKFTKHDISPLKYANSFNEDGEGRLWVCSGSGMGFFRSGQFHNVEGALIDSNIQNMAVDFEGNLWFASDRKGLLQVVKSRFSNVSLVSQLPPLVVNAVVRRSDQLFIGHDLGLSIIDSDRKQVETPLTRMLEGVRIRGITLDRSTRDLWFATYSDFGLVRYSFDGKITTFNRRKDNLASDSVRCVMPGRDGSVIAATVDGISVVRDDKVVRNYTKADGLVNPFIMNLYVDPNGVIYAGSDGGGIYAIDGDKVTAYTEADGLSSNIIMRMRYDNASKLLWASSENGISVGDAKGFRSLDKLGDYGKNVFDIQFREDGGVWLLSSGGIYIADRDNLLSDEPPQIRTLHERDGLLNPITANSWHYRDRNDNLYLCTTGGVLSIAMNEITKSNIPPRLVISNVTVDDEVYLHPDKVVIPSDANRVTVDFSLISYMYPFGNNVTFRLEGFDKEKINMSTDYSTRVSYTNLPGGMHRFIISGRNQDGIPTPEVVLPMVKPPRLSERPLVQGLALAAVVLLGVSCGWLYNHFRTKSLLERQKEYRAITEQAVAAIADTIDAKDKYTSGHSKRVAEYSGKIAQRMNLSEKEREDLYYTALLHDIGKVGLEDNILNKKSRLTEDEYSKVKEHVSTGGDILKSITVIDGIATGALYHHERYDGKGYCHGLMKEDIPLFARIVCVADAYDAMSTTRSYREGQSREYILDQLETGKGTQFDPEIAGIMIALIDEGAVPIKL